MLKTKVFILTVGLFLFSISGFAQEWVKQTNGLPSSLGTGATIDAVNEQVAVVANVSTIYHTTNGGDSWRQLVVPGEMIGGIIDIALVDSLKIWIATGSGQIFSTQDGGSTWTKQFENPSLANFMNYIEMFDENVGIAMSDNTESMSNPDGPAIFLKTTDGGQNWVSVNDSAFGAYSGDTWRRIDFINADVGYFFESGVSPQRLYKTTDGCHTWHMTNFSAYAQIIKFYDENIGLIISGANEVWRTLDGGNSWESFSSPHSGWGNDIEFSPENPAFVWLTDQDRIYFSRDTGRTWTEQFSNGGSDLEFVSNNAGWCAGIYGVFHFQQGNTSVSDVKMFKPENFSLFQNYPNPFNAATRIRFFLQRPEKVSLKIFDIKGKFVTQLLDESLLAGNHEVLWNGENFSSGTYFCRLQAGKSAQVRKILLLK